MAHRESLLPRVYERRPHRTHFIEGNTMPNLIDLTIPIRNGDGRLGLHVEFTRPYTFENCGWQGSSFSMFAHYGTHIDAPVHFIEGGKSIDQAPLTKLIGPAALIHLDDHGGNTGIRGDALEDRGKHVERGDIVILRTTWSDKYWGSIHFWKDSPYLTADGADWLIERGAAAVVYDFSEEQVVRYPGFRGEDCVVHHRILGEEIYNIEYVRGLGRISRPRLAIAALPLNLVGLDGAPARVIALEGVDIPREFTAR
jgi:arylformamidase